MTEFEPQTSAETTALPTEPQPQPHAFALTVACKILLHPIEYLFEKKNFFTNCVVLSVRGF